MMTEKQFRLVNEFGDYHIKDGDEELCYDLCSPSMAKENWNNVVNRLNEQHDENEILTDAFEQHLKRKDNRIKELKQENEQLKQQNKMLRTNVGKLTDDVKYLRNLPSTHQKENKQLKKQLNRLYNYFEDWYSEMTSANDFSEIWDNVKEDERWGDVE